MKASITRKLDGSGIEVVAYIVQINRGFQPTISYGVDVWAVSEGGYRSLIPNGESMLPPETVQSIKIELWRSVMPS